MSNELTTFDFEDFAVRVVTRDGEPWFVAADVCRVLEIANSRDAVSGLDDDEKITVANPDGNPRAGIPHQFNIISESGLYALIFTSRKPEAKKFRKWVTSEVLPAIRKTGKYEVAAPVDTKALEDAAKRRFAEAMDYEMGQLQGMLRYTAERSLGGALPVSRARAVQALARCEIDAMRIRMELTGFVDATTRRVRPLTLEEGDEEEG